MPGPGEPCEAEEEVVLAGGAGAGWLAAGGADFETGVEGAAAAVAPLTVASGAIFAMTRAERPTFDKSSTDEYGRPAMIFFAVAAPTPGKLSNSFSLAVFKSTLALVVAEFVELAVESFEGLDFLLVWPAKMLEVITPHANTVTNNRRKPPVRDILIQFSFRAASFEAILVRIVRLNPKQNFSILLPKRPKGRDIVEIKRQQLILSLFSFRAPFPQEIANPFMQPLYHGSE